MFRQRFREIKAAVFACSSGPGNALVAALTGAREA
jgi:hypothetical protein